MSRLLRNTDPNAYFLVTARTVNSELWLTPSPEMNATIGGVYARYQEMYQVTIHAVSVQSNHPHLVLKTPKQNLSEFMENSQREITRRTNYINGRTGPLWHRRYDAQLILTDDDLIEAFLYVVTNPVKHGLVDHPKKWPGLNSYYQHLKEEPEIYRFRHYSKWEDGKPVVTQHPLIISPLPMHQDLSPKERKTEVNRLINGRVQDLRQERADAGLGFLGAQRVLEQTPGERPQTTNKSSRPPCYSKKPEAIREFEKASQYLRRVYSESSFEFRGGNLLVNFPEFTYKPPLHRKPKLFPLTNSCLEKS